MFFFAYFIIPALLIGFLLRGSLLNLADKPFRCLWLALIAVVLRFTVLSSAFVNSPLGYLSVPGQILSFILLLIVALLNFSTPGMPILGLGILLNLVVMVANGGYMPVSPDDLVEIGHPRQAEILRAGGTDFYGIALTEQTRLPFLADIFVLPRFFPIRYVFSLGDALIGIGLVIIIVWGMLTKPPAGSEPAGGSDKIIREA
ncbi:MAG: DUF5317 domain-containing protein [Anaerolineae bacterium]|nr:DUF5317 domain-containing protein [Anaerolineae bacterium]